MYIIKRTNLRPLNGRVLVQRVVDTQPESQIIATLAPKLRELPKPRRMVVIAVADSVTKDIKVGDVIEPIVVMAYVGHNEVPTRRYPMFPLVNDHDLGRPFESIFENEIHVVERGKDWLYDDTKTVRSSLILPNSMLN